MKRNAFASFVTDSGNKTIPLPPYSCLFITFWGFLQWQKHTFCYEKRFSNCHHVHFQFSVHEQMSLFCRIVAISRVLGQTGIGVFFGIVHIFKCLLLNANLSEYVNCFRFQHIIVMPSIGNELDDTKECVDNNQLQLLPHQNWFSLQSVL